ncbi:MAG: tRNA (guanosine(46)-N7)-methyltransferase TrmB [Rhodothermia bacterium]|nr:tRNA (guanosine(46)-N7)-methyltransferase TrmB [Rhodothermia bacterium]
MGIIIQARDLSFPTPPTTLFGREGPYVLEIGFGNGDFLCGLASDEPESNLVGVDTSPSCVVRAHRRIARRQLSNVKVFAGTGEFVVRNVIPDEALARVYVNFPDPWPRRRHQHRRLLSQSFFDLLAHRLSRSGSLLLTTDHEDYCSFACEQAQRSGCYLSDEESAPVEILETRWAQRWLEEGRRIHHVRFEKKGLPETEPDRIEITEMRHSLLRGSLDAITDFEKFVVKRDGVNVVVSEAFRQIGDDALIFPTIVEEKDLRQFILIEAHPRGEEVLVGVKRFGQPLSTPGVNRAVMVVADFLERKGLEIVSRSY